MVFIVPTYMIGLINGLIEIKVFTMKIQWFKNERTVWCAAGLVKYWIDIRLSIEKNN